MQPCNVQPPDCLSYASLLGCFCGDGVHSRDAGRVSTHMYSEEVREGGPACTPVHALVSLREPQELLSAAYVLADSKARLCTHSHPPSIRSEAMDRHASER